MEPIFKTTYQALLKDAEVHGHGKKISAYVSVLEENDSGSSGHKGNTCLRYISCTPDDTPFVLNKVLYREMRCVSFTVADAGKPVHVPRVLHNEGVFLWNPLRREQVRCSIFLHVAIS